MSACLWLDCLQAAIDLTHTSTLEFIQVKELLPCTFANPDKECWRPTLSTGTPALKTDSSKAVVRPRPYFHRESQALVYSLLETHHGT